MTRSTPFSLWKAGAQWGLAAIMLSWPMLLNGSPFLFFDSSAYLRFGAAIWNYVGGAEAPLVDPARDLVVGGTTIQEKETTGQDIETLVGGRSYFYGAAAWAARAGLGYWAIVVAQSLAMAGIVLLALRRLGISSAGGRLSILFVLALLSTLPFFVSTIMPDVFAALAPLSVVFLLAYWDRMAAAERLFWAACLLAAILFHKAFLALAGVTLALAVLMGLWRKWRLWPQAAAILAVIVAAVVTDTMVTSHAERVSGQVMVSPPFLLARSIADGPMAEILQEDCAGSGGTKWRTCLLADRLPMTEVELIWGRRGLKSLSAADAIAISKEQTPLLLELARRKLIHQAASSAWNAVHQVGQASIKEFASPTIRREMEGTPDRNSVSRYGASRIARSAFPVGLLDSLWIGAYLVSTLVAFFLITTGRRTLEAASPRLADVLLLLLLSILFSAAVTGVLSGAFGRYQARIGWLAVMVLAVVLWHGKRLWGVAGTGRWPIGWQGRPHPSA